MDSSILILIRIRIKPLIFVAHTVIRPVYSLTIDTVNVKLAMFLPIVWQSMRLITLGWSMVNWREPYNLAYKKS